MKSVVLLCSTLLAVGSSFAAPAGSYGDAGDYLFELAPSAAAFGKGGGSAAGTGSDALYHNLAGMDYTQYRQLDMGRRYLGEDFKMDHLAYVHPFDRFGTLGMSFYSVGPQDPVEKFGTFGQPLGTEDGGDLAFLFGWAKSWGPAFAFGSGIKVATQSFGERTGTGFGFDMGMQGNIGEHFRWGMSMVNLMGPSITLVKDPDEFATVFKLGTVTSFLKGRVSILADWDKTNIFMGKDADGNTKEMDDRFRFGVEWYLNDWMALRSGYNDREITVGTGLGTNWMSFDYALGYVRPDKTELGPGLSHFFSVDFRFGKAPEAEKADLLKRLRSLQEVEKLQIAQQLYLDSNFKASDAQLGVYLAKNPEDSAALKLQALLNTELSAWKMSQLTVEFHKKIERRSYEEAQALIEEMMGIDPKYDSLSTLQKYLLEKQQVNEKLARLQELFPERDYDEIMNITGEILASDSTHPLALELRKKATPYWKRAAVDAKYNAASQVYHEKMDLQQANNLLEDALELDPKHKASNELYKEVSAKLKDFLMAQIANSAGTDDSVSAALLNKVRALDLGERLLIASNLYDDGDFARAESEVKKILRETPDNAKALDLEKKIRIAKVEQESEKIYQEGLRLFNAGNRLEALDQMAQVLLKNPSMDVALQLRDQIVGKSLEVIEKELQSYRSSQDANTLQKARDELNGLKTKAADNEDLQNLDLQIETEEKVREVLTLIEGGKFDEAELILNKALQKDPDNASANSAYILFKEIKSSFE